MPVAAHAMAAFPKGGSLRQVEHGVSERSSSAGETTCCFLECRRENKMKKLDLDPSDLEIEQRQWGPVVDG